MEGNQIAFFKMVFVKITDQINIKRIQRLPFGILIFKSFLFFRQTSEHDHTEDTPKLLTLEVPVDVHHSAGSPLHSPTSPKGTNSIDRKFSLRPQ